MSDDAGQQATPSTTDTRDLLAAPEALGARLRAARQARELSVAACAHALHLPTQVLERLEHGDHGEPEHFVFLRGALKGYASFLDLPADSCDAALRVVAPTTQPALVGVAQRSPSRWLLQRYGTAATYIVLTATIAVPLVWLGLHGGLDRTPARVVSLEQITTATAAPRAPGGTALVPASAPAAPSQPEDASPLRASMTPFAAIGMADAGSKSPATKPTNAFSATAQALQPGSHTLAITATGDCWFEITDSDGNKIDSGIIHAGEARDWHSTEPLHLTLGNAAAVAVTSDGQALSLDPWLHANVARLELYGHKPANGESD